MVSCPTFGLWSMTYTGARGTLALEEFSMFFSVRVVRVECSVRPLPSIVFSLDLHIISIASLEHALQKQNKKTHSEFLKKKKNGTLPPSDEIVWKGQAIKRTLAAMAALSNDFPHSFRPVR